MTKKGGLIGFLSLIDISKSRSGCLTTKGQTSGICYGGRELFMHPLLFISTSNKAVCAIEGQISWSLLVGHQLSSDERHFGTASAQMLEVLLWKRIHQNAKCLSIAAKYHSTHD